MVGGVAREIPKPQEATWAMCGVERKRVEARVSTEAVGAMVMGCEAGLSQGKSLEMEWGSGG